MEINTSGGKSSVNKTYARLDAECKELKKGDLVQVINVPGKRRTQGLARVTAISQIDDDDDDDQVTKYDLEYVLGGRLFAVLRHEILFTTADKEGLTDGNGSSRRRKIKRKMFSFELGEEDGSQSDISNNSSCKKKPSTGIKNSKFLKKSGRSSSTISENLADNNSEQSESQARKDRFDIHMKEFERCLDRLEKLDKYDFFHEDYIPDEFDDINEENDPPAYIKAPYNFTAIRRRKEHGRYVMNRLSIERQRRKEILEKRGFKDSKDPPNITIAHLQGIDWNVFGKDVYEMCEAAISRDPAGKTGRPGTVGHTATKIIEGMDALLSRTAKKQQMEMISDDIRRRVGHLVDQNKEAAVQEEWRKTVFPERQYERIKTSDVLCGGLSPLDQASANHELTTSLPDSFVGLPYNYDDTGQSEEWMKSATKVAQNSNFCTEDNDANAILRAQVRSVMDTLMLSVHDKALTDMNVLHQAELISSKEAWDEYYLPPEEADLMEQPVWGMDCYARNNIFICLKEEFGENAGEFIEKWLLPAINACPVELANDITCAARIIQGLPPRSELYEYEIDEDELEPSILATTFQERLKKAPLWLKLAAEQLRNSAIAFGKNCFLIHPKGHGSVVLHGTGLPPNRLVTHYRGELYPAWRWGEKMDAIENTQERLGLRPALPDFYNMVLERPLTDPRGYGLLFVDASRRAGYGSSFSHSCDPTCEVRVAAVNGKLVLAMTTVRDVVCGEELTFDYNAVTESLNEYQSAVCLCGYTKCRGSFLHFATADCYQQVMTRNSPISVRFASLVKSMAKKVMSTEDNIILRRHGFSTASFGPVSYRDTKDSIDNVPIWLRTYVADVLRYIEYERRAMPVALLQNHLSDNFTSAATDDERMINNTSKDTSCTLESGSKKSKIKDFSDNEHAKHSKDDYSAQKILDKSKIGFRSRSIEDDENREVRKLKRKDFMKAEEKKIKKKKKTREETENVRKAEKKKQFEALKREEMMNINSSVEVRHMGNKKSHNKQILKEAAQNVAEILIEERNDSRSEDQKCSHMSLLGKKIPKKKKNGSSDKIQTSMLSFFKTETEENLGASQTLVITSKKRKILLPSEDLMVDEAKQIGTDKSEEDMANNQQELKFLHSSINSPSPISSLGSKSLDDKSVETSKRSIDKNAAFKTTGNGIPEKVLSLKNVPSQKSNPSISLKGSFPLDQVTSSLRKNTKPMMKYSHSNDKGRYFKDIQQSNTSKRSSNNALLCNEILEKRNSCNGSELDSNASTVSENEEYTPTKNNTILAKKEDKNNKGMKNFPLKSNSSKGKLNEIKTIEKKIKEKKRGAEKRFKATSKPELIHSEEVKKGQVRKLDECKTVEHEKATKSKNGKEKTSINTALPSSTKISYEAADAEGRSCMEQRIQTLAQTLSRVGRVLSRHREISQKDYTQSKETSIEPPLAFMSDKEVIDWIWNSPEGVVTMLVRNVKSFFPVLGKDCIAIRKKYAEPLRQKCDKSKLKKALLEFRDLFLAFSEIGKSAYKDKVTSYLTRKRKKKRTNEVSINSEQREDDVLVDSQELSWEEFRGKSYMLEASADLCLFYAYTDTFFKMNPYFSVESSQIKVYARELGNFVPKSLLDDAKVRKGSKSRSKAKAYCEPEDVVAVVTRKYSEEYVLSQLLQWYNGGVGTKPGLPQLLGCVRLPSFNPIFRKSREQIKYQNEIRPLIIDWLTTRHSRGDIWPSTLSDFYHENEKKDKMHNEQLFFGSPVLDLLVAGDDSNINSITNLLKNEPQHAEVTALSTAADQLQLTVDEGMPAQAVANWVQCDNCQKWRKLPWHVDVDLLPEHFFCKDNKWNPSSNDCLAPEDEYDEYDEHIS